MRIPPQISSKLKPTRTFWLLLLATLALSTSLAALDGARSAPGDWLHGWLAYTLFAGLAIGSLAWAVRLLAAARSAVWSVACAFLLRLGVGVTLTLALPVLGYAGNEVHQNGFVFRDAYRRDVDAWNYARTDGPLLRAFVEKVPSDQYGGMLVLSSAIYRYISRDAHRQMLILLLTAAAGAWGTLLTWKATQTWFGQTPLGPRTACLAGWAFALYPEAVLLGGSQMRDAFVIPAVAMTFYSLTRLSGGWRAWLPWLAASGVILLLFQPPVALIALIVWAAAWLLDAQRRLSWKKAALLVGALLLVTILVISVWANLPGMQEHSPWTVISTWLQRNFYFQTDLTEKESGQLQMILRTVGKTWELPVVLVYGAAQPVLPAVIGDPESAWVMRLIAILRAVGWYALAPLLIYGLVSVFRTPASERRGQIMWLLAANALWVLIAAANAGADQWDNPRYRAILLAWQTLLAAWAWQQGRLRRDRWLPRWLAVEAVFVLLFAYWYASRYYPQYFAHLDLWTTVGLTLALSTVILLGGWAWDIAVARIADPG